MKYFDTITTTNFLNLLLFVGSLLCTTSCSIDEYDNVPIATFTSEYNPRSGYKYILDASNSFSLESNNNLLYRWNTETDKKEEKWDTQWMSSPKHIAIGQQDQAYMNIGVQVKDVEGATFTFYETLWNPTYKSVPNSNNYSKQDPYEIKNTSRTFINEKLEVSEITYNTSYICYHSRVVEQSGVTNQWSNQNLQLPSMNGSTNIDDPMAINSTYNLPQGSYISWDLMKILQANDFSLPSKTDWENMFKFCCGEEVAGYNLTVVIEHGLQLSLEGYCSPQQEIVDKGNAGYYWTADEASETTAYAIKVTKGKDRAEIVELPKNYQLSVRIL